MHSISQTIRDRDFRNLIKGLPESHRKFLVYCDSGIENAQLMSVPIRLWMTQKDQEDRWCIVSGNVSFGVSQFQLRIELFEDDILIPAISKTRVVDMYRTALTLLNYGEGLFCIVGPTRPEIVINVDIPGHHDYSYHIQMRPID